MLKWLSPLPLNAFQTVSGFGVYYFKYKMSRPSIKRRLGPPRAQLASHLPALAAVSGDSDAGVQLKCCLRVDESTDSVFRFCDAV
eukprot:505062-Rhodomonas_salina.3